MAFSTSGSLPVRSNAPPAQQDVESPTTVYTELRPLSGEAVDSTKERKYSVVRIFLASVFGWMINAAFVILPGSLNSLKQNHQAPDVVKDIIHSVRNIPFLVFSFLCFLVGVVGILVVSWKYAHDHDWLFHQFFRPVTSGLLYGVLSTTANIYTAHDGKFSTSNIVTLAVVGSSAVIFGLLALNSYCHIGRPKDRSTRRVRG